jgi:hypothetical protein
MLQLVCRNVQNVFATVILSQQNDNDDEEEDRQDVNVVLFALKQTADLPSKAKLVGQLERAVSNDRIDGLVLADLKDCLDDLKLWNADADTSNSSSSKNASGKKKPMRNKKRGKRK